MTDEHDAVENAMDDANALHEAVLENVPPDIKNMAFVIAAMTSK